MVVPTVRGRRVPDGPGLPAALRRFTDQLAAAGEFLARVGDEGRRYGYLVLAFVDWNASEELEADLLLRLAALRIDLTFHALAADSAETAAAVRALRDLGVPFWAVSPAPERRPRHPGRSAQLGHEGCFRKSGRGPPSGE